jgi:hypothetical protein
MTDRSFERDNDASRARLARLVETLRPTQLSVDVGEGWTVTSVLAHMGLWDRWQAERWTEMLDGRWSAEQGSIIEAEHIANEALHPYLGGATASDIPALALAAAIRVDALIAQAPDSLAGALEGGPSAYVLHRHRHRGEHLDQIERGLEAAGRAAPVAVDSSYLARNDASRAQLSALLAGLSAADLQLASGECDWTIGQVLGHLSFWDRFLAGRWRAAIAMGPGSQPMALPHEVADMLNDGMPPTWAALGAGSPAAVVADTLAAAEAIDGLIAALPMETPVAAILAERPSLLDRSIHRLEHIATLELALRGRPLQ